MKIRTAYQRKAQAATSHGSVAASRGLRRWHRAVGSILPTNFVATKFASTKFASTVCLATMPSRSSNPEGCLRSEDTVGRNDLRRPRMS